MKSIHNNVTCSSTPQLSNLEIPNEIKLFMKFKHYTLTINERAKLCVEAATLANNIRELGPGCDPIREHILPKLNSGSLSLSSSDFIENPGFFTAPVLGMNNAYCCSIAQERTRLLWEACGRTFSVIEWRNEFEVENNVLLTSDEREQIYRDYPQLTQLYSHHCVAVNRSSLNSSRAVSNGTRVTLAALFLQDGIYSGPSSCAGEGDCSQGHEISEDDNDEVLFNSDGYSESYPKNQSLQFDKIILAQVMSSTKGNFGWYKLSCPPVAVAYQLHVQTKAAYNDISLVHDQAVVVAFQEKVSIRDSQITAYVDRLGRKVKLSYTHLPYDSPLAATTYTMQGLTQDQVIIDPGPSKPPHNYGSLVVALTRSTTLKAIRVLQLEQQASDSFGHLGSIKPKPSLFASVYKS